MEISEEHLWAIELANLIDADDALDKLRIQFNELLDLLIYLNETLAEEKLPLPENEVMSEQLVIKFYLHGNTICKVSEGYKLTSKYYSSKADLIDVSSLMTLGRAQLETLLMYQHLYINDKDEQRLRYYSWIYTALLQRSGPPPYQQAVKIQLKKDAMELSRIKGIIENLDSFKKLSLKQQRGLFLSGTAKLFKNWQTIFDESGFPKEKLFSRYYYILSAYSHSEGLSAIQMKSSKNLLSNKENLEKVKFQLIFSTLMTTIMINNIVSRYDTVAKRFKTIERKKQFIVHFLSKTGEI